MMAGSRSATLVVASRAVSSAWRTRPRRNDMMLRALTLSFTSLAALSAAGSSPNQNWPAWRGPSMSGVSPTGDPPIEWGETKNVKWKAKVPGSGTSTPVVWESQVFLHTAIPTGKKIESPAAKPETGGPAAGALAQAPDGGADRPQRRCGGPGGGAPGGGMRSEQPTEIMRFEVISFDRDTGSILWQ